MVEIILILAVLLYVIEAFHDATIEEVQNQDVSLINKWHKYDSAFHFISMSMVSIAMYGFSLNTIVLIVCLMSIRQLFFPTLLNNLRNRKTFYLGSTSKFDLFFKNKEFIPFITALILVVCGYLKLTIWN